MHEKSLITSCKGKENLLPVSVSDERPPGVTGVHLAGRSEDFAALDAREPKTIFATRACGQLFKLGVWLEKLRGENLKKQLSGISKATVLIFLHEWGGSSVLLQHSILILIQAGIPEAEVFNLNLILGGAILATSTAGGLLNSRGSASCRRALLLSTTAVTVASLALLSTSLAVRCPAQHLLHFQGAPTSDEECAVGTYFCEPLQECLTNICNSTASTTTTPSPQMNYTMEMEDLIATVCQNHSFPIELLLLSAIMASQHLGLNVCIKIKI